MSSFDDIRQAYIDKTKFLEENYNRNLPFQDTMFDRWERAAYLNFGEGSSIYNSALVYGKVKIGKNVWIGPYVILDGSADDLVIGDGATISAGVHIYTHDNVLKTISGGKLSMKSGGVQIGSNTYIGAHSIINMNVAIGDQVIIGANSFVNKNVLTREIFAGTPAKKIGSIIETENGFDIQYG